MMEKIIVFLLDNESESIIMAKTIVLEKNSIRSPEHPFFWENLMEELGLSTNTEFVVLSVEVEDSYAGM